MTMPHERTYALLYAGEMLADLLDTSKTPGVPEEIRERALWVLRHYPSPMEIIAIAEHDALPSLLSNPRLDSETARKFQV